MNGKSKPDRLGRRTATEVLRLRGKVGMAVTQGRPDEEARYRQELKAAVLEDRIREALTSEPPLTTEQREKLAALLIDGCNQPAVVTS